ncbi:hypothetical protein KIH39_06760 [Telmatocola sphagniphila]|uniref:Uncharacterized protein n=1 Tax=Telmatocola sphagniphila TaxID=1123043 RepID=A0A8E6EWA9_9BACT|nr:DUF1574 domain-containing protein [Telmatocola sphagniphila]QVL33607.1 hypothetical protein KIH39_06760 [Telmatocola sphagniphila]
MAARSSQARAGLLIGLLLFMSIQFALLAWISFCRPALIDIPFQMRLESLEKVETAPVDLCIWCIGSSRMMYGLQADLVSRDMSQQLERNTRLVNLGFPGCGPLGSWLYLNRLLSRVHKPDLILFEVMPGLLSYPPDLEPMEWNRLHPSRLLCGEFEELQRLGVPLDKLRFGNETNGLSPYCPLYSQRVNLLSRSFPSWLPNQFVFDIQAACDPLRFCSPPESVHKTGAFEKAFQQTISAYRPYLEHWQIGSPAAKAIGSFQAKCAQNGIPCLGLWMPESEEFQRLSSTRSEKNVADFLSERFSNAEWINARNWCERGCFWDGHHLHPQGGAQFSRQLAKVLSARFENSNRNQVRLEANP